MQLSTLFTLGLALALDSVVAGPVPGPDLAHHEANSNSTLAERANGLFCGNFNTADKANAQYLLAELARNGGQCTTPAKTCTRHACTGTTGIYVCNDNDHEIKPDCRAGVGSYGALITSQCCKSSNSVSGQRFWDQGGYNVVVAYGNCNHGRNADRPAMGPPDAPWGPNGACLA